MAIESVIVNDRGGKKPIGSVGFIGDTLSLIVAFYDDRDWDHSGKVELSQKVFSFFRWKAKPLPRSYLVHTKILI